MFTYERDRSLLYGLYFDPPMTYTEQSTPLSPERRKLIGLIIEEYIGEGKSLSEIAFKYCLRPQTVSQWLTVYYFSYMGDNRVCIRLESKINQEELIEV